MNNDNKIAVHLDPADVEKWANHEPTSTAGGRFATACQEALSHHIEPGALVVHKNSEYQVPYRVLAVHNNEAWLKRLIVDDYDGGETSAYTAPVWGLVRIGTAI